MLRDIYVIVQVVAVRIKMIETETKFVDQIVAESMDLACGESLGNIVAVTVLKAAAIEPVVEG